MITEPCCSGLYIKIRWNFYFYLHLWHTIFISGSPYLSPTVSFWVTLLFNLWIGKINAWRKISAQILYCFWYQHVKIDNFIKYFRKIVAFKLLPVSWATNVLERWDFLYICIMKNLMLFSFKYHFYFYNLFCFVYFFLSSFWVVIMDDIHTNDKCSCTCQLSKCFCFSQWLYHISVNDGPCQ